MQQPLSDIVWNRRERVSERSPSATLVLLLLLLLSKTLRQFGTTITIIVWTKWQLIHFSQQWFLRSSLTFTLFTGWWSPFNDKGISPLPHVSRVYWCYCLLVTHSYWYFPSGSLISRRSYWIHPSWSLHPLPQHHVLSLFVDQSFQRLCRLSFFSSAHFLFFLSSPFQREVSWIPREWKMSERKWAKVQVSDLVQNRKTDREEGIGKDEKR